MDQTSYYYCFITTCTLDIYKLGNFQSKYKHETYGGFHGTFLIGYI